MSSVTISGRRNQQMGPHQQIPSYQSPAIEVGDAVLFYMNCDQRHPVSGEVSNSIKDANGNQVREISIRLVDGQERDSVMHIDDPRTTDARVKTNGCWDVRPEPQYVQDLRAEMAGIQEELTEVKRTLRTLEDFVSDPDGKKKERAANKNKLVKDSNEPIAE